MWEKVSHSATLCLLFDVWIESSGNILWAVGLRVGMYKTWLSMFFYPKQRKSRVRRCNECNYKISWRRVSNSCRLGVLRVTTSKFLDKKTSLPVWQSSLGLQLDRRIYYTPLIGPILHKFPTTVLMRMSDAKKGTFTSMDSTIAGENYFLSVFMYLRL